MPCPRHYVISWLSSLPILNDEKTVSLLKKLAIVTVTGVCLHFAVRKYLKKARENRRKQYKKDVVILHGFRRGTTCPVVSPFVMKLETYLRIAKIPYEYDFVEPCGPKGKSPWITYNGVDVTDSAFCIQYLNQQFSINLNSKLTPEEAAISRFIVLTAENNTLVCGALWRYVYDKQLFVFKLAPWFPMLVQIFPSIMRRYVRKIAFYQGMGRHSEQEVIDIGLQDMKALSTYLGKKRFIMGDYVSEVDCTLFGLLAQIVWGMPNSQFETAINGECKNLKDYCLRMKDAFWKDWDSILYKN